MKRPDQPRRSYRSTTLALVAMIAMVFAIVGNTPSLQSRHEVQPAVSATTTAVTTADGCEMVSARTITADPLLMALVNLFLPGTGSTKASPTTGTQADFSWLDSGVWNQIPTRIMLDDASQYPAVLGTGGNGQVSGQQSMMMGANYLVRTADTYDRATTVYLPDGGSQGAMGVRQALILMAQMGYPMDHVFAVMYSDPYTAGTGIAARFGKGQMVPTTGIEGGVPDVPAGATALSISYRYDPMAHMPKYLWTLPFTLPNAILGFVFEHPDIGMIDYGDPGNTTREEGNVTYITLAPKIIPVLMPIVFAGYLAGVPINVTASILKPLDDVLRPIMDMGGQDVPGGFQLAPSPTEFAGQVFKVLQGVVKGMTDVVKLATGQPVFSSNAVPSPVQQLIDKAIQKDKELNGGTSTPNPTASTTIAPTAATNAAPEGVSEAVSGTDQIASQSRMALNVTSSAKEGADSAPQPQAVDKNSTDTKSKDGPVPTGTVTSSPTTPSTDQSKVADDKGQQQNSQKDGDKADVPKTDLKPAKDSDASKGDAKSGTDSQKSHDDSTDSTTSSVRDTKAPKPGSGPDRKNPKATKPDAPKRGTSTSPSRQSQADADSDTGKPAPSTRHRPASKSSADGDGSSGGTSKPARAAAHAAD